MALNLNGNTVPDNTGIVLTKGERINLTKETGLSAVKVGLAWAGASDLDASAILLDANDKFLQPPSQYIVYHHAVSGENGAITHSGDKKNGDEIADGSDDETISIDFSKVSDKVQAIAIIVSSHSEANGTHGAPKRFGTVTKPVARVYDAAGKELYKYEVDEEASTATCVEFVRFYRKDGDWRLNAKSEKLGELGIGLQCAVDKFS